jgi:hypothetical protein
MSNAVIVHKGRTNTLPVATGIDLTGSVVTSEIRSEPSRTSLLLATWTVTVTDAVAGELMLRLDNSDTSDLSATTGYMDLKRVVGGEPLPIFDKPLEVEFRESVTV